MNLLTGGKVVGSTPKYSLLAWNINQVSFFFSLQLHKIEMRNDVKQLRLIN